MTNSAPTAITVGILLLPDGTVMAQGAFTTPGIEQSNTWSRLTPDSTGSYVNGTWTTLAPMNSSRLYMASQVLTDGRVFVAGAEYGTGKTTAEVYDPATNAWTKVTNQTGVDEYLECQSTMLPDGTVLIAPDTPTFYGGTVIYDPKTNAISTGTTLFRGYSQDEASWVKLPDSSILTIDPSGTNSERFIPSQNRWINDSVVPVALYDNASEIGPGLLLPNGKVFFLGATGNTALYTPSGSTAPGTWSPGPVIPNGKATPDAPAAMLVTGHVLFAASLAPLPNLEYPLGTSFFEYDPVTNSFASVATPAAIFASEASYQSAMLNLPDGSVLLSHSSSVLYVYRPAGLPLAAGKPSIASITQNGDGSYHLTGTLLNGISEGAAYGDDAQMSSNRPLVRLIDAAGKVSYARTYNWSSTGVATDSAPMSTEFAEPPNGLYSLVVVANGIASDAINFTAAAPIAPSITTPPASQVIAVGGAVSFTVVAAGTNITFQWNFAGLPIPGATNSVYSLTNAQTVNAGLYTVVVANALGTLTSTPATLTVNVPPAITIQPVSQQFAVGTAATLTVSATGTPAPSYQWYFNRRAIAGGTNASFPLASVQPSDSGSYTVVASNLLGSATSVPAMLIATAPSGGPAIATQPAAQTISSQSTAVFSGSSSGSPTYQWYLNNTVVPGATGPRLVVTGATAANSGSYTYIATNALGSSLSAPAVLTVMNTANPGRLVNLSVLALAGKNQALTVGFVTGGAGTGGSQTLLIRATGPALAAFGVVGVLTDPFLTLFNGSTQINSNDNWGLPVSNQAAVTAADTLTFAFPLTNPVSLDSALVTSLATGPGYSVQIGGNSPTAGATLAEVYDATPAGSFTPGTPHLINLSSKVLAAAGASLTAGFVVGGTTSKTVLIRATGPALAAFGSSNLMPDPHLALHVTVQNQDRVLASNAGWGGDPQITSASNSVYAFPLTDPTSADSVILVTLAPGNYSAVANSVSGAAGLVLVEIYDVP